MSEKNKSTVALSSKQWIALGTILAVFVIAGGMFWYRNNQNSQINVERGEGGAKEIGNTVQNESSVVVPGVIIAIEGTDFPLVLTLEDNGGKQWNILVTQGTTNIDVADREPTVDDYYVGDMVEIDAIRSGDELRANYVMLLIAGPRDQKTSANSSTGETVLESPEITIGDVSADVGVETK